MAITKNLTGNLTHESLITSGLTVVEEAASGEWWEGTPGATQQLLTSLRRFDSSQWYETQFFGFEELNASTSGAVLGGTDAGNNPEWPGNPTAVLASEDTATPPLGNKRVRLIGNTAAWRNVASGGYQQLIGAASVAEEPNSTHPRSFAFATRRQEFTDQFIGIKITRGDGSVRAYAFSKAADKRINEIHDLSSTTSPDYDEWITHRWFNIGEQFNNGETITIDYYFSNDPAVVAAAENYNLVPAMPTDFHQELYLERWITDTSKGDSRISISAPQQVATGDWRSPAAEYASYYGDRHNQYFDDLPSISGIDTTKWKGVGYFSWSIGSLNFSQRTGSLAIHLIPRSSTALNATTDNTGWTSVTISDGVTENTYLRTAFSASVSTTTTELPAGESQSMVYTLALTANPFVYNPFKVIAAIKWT